MFDLAWIEVHQSLINHKKTIILADTLSLPEPYIVGHLVSFWLWAVDNIQDGFLDDQSLRLVERSAQWQGERGALLKAMIEVGFIDETDEGHEIHDWFDYAGRLLSKKQRNAERMREARSKSKPMNKKTRATNVQRTCVARAGATNHTYLTNKKDHVPSDDGTSPPSAVEVTTTKPEYSADFDEFWSIYPRKIGKKAAYAKWKAQLHKGVTAQEMTFAATNYATECAVNATAEIYVKHAATFLGPQDPFRDYLQPVALANRNTEPLPTARAGPAISTQDDPDEVAFREELLKSAGNRDAIDRSGGTVHSRDHPPESVAP